MRKSACLLVNITLRKSQDRFLGTTFSRPPPVEAVGWGLLSRLIFRLVPAACICMLRNAVLQRSLKKAPASLPLHAKPFAVYVRPDWNSPQARKGWEVWKAGIIAMMKDEGITITRVRGRGYFYGYYYPDEITPRFWLKDEATKSPR